MTTTIRIRTPYGPKRRIKTAVGDKSAAKQSFKQECDINNIMAKYQKTGLVEHINKSQASYGFAPAVDYREALNLVQAASEQFESLPSSVRRRFNESPSEFLRFCEDPANRSEAAVLGLLDPDAILDTESPTDSASAPVPPSPATTDAE